LDNLTPVSLKLNKKGNVNLMLGTNEFGARILDFWGVPIKLDQQVSTTEATVS